MVQRSDRDKFAQAIEQLPDVGSGPLLLRRTAHNVRKIVGGLTGKRAGFGFTDGTAIAGDSGKRQVETADDPVAPAIGGVKPVQIARQAAAKHDVSFIVISKARGRSAEQVNEAVASMK